MDMIAGKEQMRRTGIDIIGDVPWGTHLCQFYQNKQDLIDILAPYFRQGLAGNEFCMWVTSEPLGVEEARVALRAVEPALDEYIRRGQIEILDYTQWYTRTGRFNAGEVLQGWVDALESALGRGYEGLRLTGNTFWLEEKDWADFTAYEEAVNRVIGAYRMLAVCTYCLDRCGALEIMDVLSNHRFALVKRAGRWQIIESSEHRKTEAALRESEERLNRAQEIAHLGSWELDPIHDELIWSDEVYRILGLEPQEFGATYEAFLERVHPEDRAAVDAAYRGSIREGRDSYEIEHRMVRKNSGEIRWVYEKCQHVRDAEGQTVRSLGMVLDVTDRKRAEEALRESEERRKVVQAVEAERQRLFGVLETLPVMICLMTPDYHVAFANRSFRERFGESHGRHCYEYCFGRPGPCEFCESYNVLQTGQPHHWEVASPDGSVIDVYDFPFTDVDGSPMILEMDVDITARRKSEAELARHREHLEELVQERTALLETANVQLRAEIAERKRAEEALRESEEQAQWLARFPEENPNPVLRVSFDGTVLYRNPAAASTQAWQCQIAQPLPHEVLRRLVGQAIADGRAVERDVELGGTSFRVAVTPVREEDYANVYGRDITERKQAEKALQESEERARASAEELEAILDAAPVAIWIAHDPECRRVTGNAYADEVIMQTARGGNISRSAAPGGDTVSYRVFRSGVELRPEDLPAQLAAATGKAVPAFEMELVFPDGRSVHLLAGGVPLFDAQGRVRGAVAAGLDVTLLKQTEAELQQLNVQLEQLVQQRTAALEASEARFRAIFEEAAIGIALADPEGRLMATNPALQRLLGYSEQELAGTRFPDLLGRGNGDAGELPREPLAGEGSVYTLEQQYTRKNGETGEANVIVSLLRRDTDASPLVLALVEDVTERKRAQEALIQAERLAVIGRMAASLAHEINNPIQSVVGCLGLATELLEDGKDASQFMSVAMEELERAARIVRRMRDLGRREEGHKELAGVGELVEKVLILTHNQARNEQVEVVWEGGEELSPVPVVRDRIQQVFLNLVLNAIDAMPRGGELRIRAARTDGPPGVQVSFADTGKGIPPDEVERLFEAFHSTKDLGLGLGLYVSRNIVQEHGGRIDVQSEVGQGTTFTVWLPAQDG
jgi:PAS domain S-box-containing protein